MLKMKWHLFNRRNEAPCEYECGSSNYQFLIPSRTFSPLPTNSLHKNDLPQRHPSTPYYAEPCHPSNKVPPLPSRFCPQTGGWKTCFLFSVVPPPQVQRTPSIEIMTKTSPLFWVLKYLYKSARYHDTTTLASATHKGRRRVQTSSAPAVVPLHLSLRTPPPRSTPTFQQLARACR